MDELFIVHKCINCVDIASYRCINIIVELFFVHMYNNGVD